MPIDYELTCYRLRSSNCILALATSQALKEQETQSKITHSDEERDTTDAETDAEAEAEESWCPPIPDTPDDPLKARSLEPPIS